MLDAIFTPGSAIIELGGGGNPVFRPNADVRYCTNSKGETTVDFVCDFNELLPIASEEWDGVFSQYSLEHISWRKVPLFLQEVLRILKPGGKLVLVTADTQAQLHWILQNPKGWDNKNFFESASCILYGDMDYPENSHRSFFNSEILFDLLTQAGFSRTTSQPWGARNTDIMVIAQKDPGSLSHVKPDPKEGKPTVQLTPPPLPKSEIETLMSTTEGRQKVFAKDYFNGGKKYGGYAREGMWDFPNHEVTFRRVMHKKPQSVMEIGTSRGYVLKRIQDEGIRANGLEISHHCWLTRVCNGIIEKDVCDGSPWPWKDKEFDLGFSIATLEHVPEVALPHVLAELARTCKRGLHGIDFGKNDDHFDQSHILLRDKSYWQSIMPSGHEIVDKESLEQLDEFPRNLLKGDGKTKLNLGCHTVMFHGWMNIDNSPTPDSLQNFANGTGYPFLHHDVRNGFPQYKTGQVECIYTSHMLEHLTYQEGLTLLRECRRILNPETGALRIIVPDARLLISNYWSNSLKTFSEVSDGVENSPTELRRLWEMMLAGHASMYDEPTLAHMLGEAGFISHASKFRDDNFPNPNFENIYKETIDMFPAHSLYMNGVAKIS